MIIRSPATRIAFGLAAIAAMALSLDACAQSGGGRADRIAEKAKQRFQDADTDHDGMISRDEAAKGMPRVSAHFDEIDSNGDGKLSSDELAAFMRDARSKR